MTAGTYLVWDTETTGIDTDNDRIVQLFIGLYDKDANLVDSWEWLIYPGVPVPEAAAEVHGFTTEFLEENGWDAEEALAGALQVFSEHADKIWVAFNLNYDLSILDVEFHRHHLHDTWGEDARSDVRLYDPLVVDRHKDKYRKGKRTLAAMAQHYGVPFDSTEAHNAVYDVSKTAEVAVKVRGRYGLPTTEEQSKWYYAWAQHLQEYFRRTDPEAYVNPGWPLRDQEGV